MVARPGRAVLELTGSEAAEFLQGQVSNDVEALEPGQGCYATLLDHKGKLRTDMRVLRLAPDRLLVDAEPIGRRPLAHNFEMYSLGRDVKPKDVSDDRVVLSLVGPRAHELLTDPPAGEEHACDEAEGVVRMITDVGVDLILPAGREAEVRATLDAPDADEQAAEVLRVERGRPRLGLDMDASTMPQEAGINDRAVSFTKGCYVGQETVARLHYKGKPNRHMRGLRLGAPRPSTASRSSSARSRWARSARSPLPHPRHDRTGAGAPRGRARRRGPRGGHAGHGRRTPLRLSAAHPAAGRASLTRWPISDSVGRRGGN